MKEIIYYQKADGEIPIKDFFDELFIKNKKLLSKIYGKVENLKFGFIGMNDVKFIKDKVYELRIKESSNISRIFYFTFEGDNIVLLHGIIKKDNKLKNSDINTALNYKEDFLKRIGKI